LTLTPSAQIASSVLALAGGGVVSALAANTLRRARALVPSILLLGVGAGSILAISGALRTLLGVAPGPVLAGWGVPGGMLALGPDRLGAWLSLLTAFVGAPVALFATSYLKRLPRTAFAAFCFFFPLLLASLVTLSAARNALLFLAAWECMTVSAYFLVVLVHEDERVRWAGRLYVMLNHSAAFAILALVALLAARAGSCSFDAMEAAARRQPSSWLPFALAFVGFGCKAGLLPLHIWLPHAHPAAPSPVSSVLSGLVVKAGLFGLLRFLPLLPEPPPGAGALLLLVGSATMIYGALAALAQHDLKRVLAYSTVENMGILLAGTGALLLGGGAATRVALLLHGAAHAVHKSLLFLGAGSVLHAAGTTDLRRLGGLLRAIPFTATVFLLGSVSLAAVPPLAGFAGEASLFASLLDVAAGGPGGSRLLASVAIVALATTGGLGAAVAARAFAAVFLGAPRADAPPSHGEGPLRERVAMGLLAAALPAIGLFPDRLAAACGGTGAAPGWVAGAARISLLVVALALGLWLLRRSLARGVRPAEADTWGCGYALPNARMRTGPSSFAAPLLRVFRHVVLAREDRRGPQGLFPEGPSVRTEAPDAVERFLYRPLFRLFLALSGGFRVLQRAPVQLQVLYALALLAILLAGKTLL